jgi:hypothetical protein
VTKKDRKALIAAVRNELLGTPEDRIAVLEQRVADLEQWPRRFVIALSAKVVQMLDDAAKVTSSS